MLALTITHGNVDLASCLRNACITLKQFPDSNEHFDSSTLPVYPGCSRPLIDNDLKYFKWHGEDGLGDCGLTLHTEDEPLDQSQVQDEHAALALSRLSKLYPREVPSVHWYYAHFICLCLWSSHFALPIFPQITLLCLGPLTNIALACRLDEGFADRIKDMVWMGGTTFARGNVSMTAEFNVHKDPEACSIILSSFSQSTMV